MRRVSLQDVNQLQNVEPAANWWAKQLSSTAATVFWPHTRLIPKPLRRKEGLVLLNPGELSGELKDPDDPWGYSHPRW